MRSQKSLSRLMSWRGNFGSGLTEGPHRSAMPEKQPQEYPVTIEIDGKRYTGFYTVSSGIVTVESDWGELRAHVGPNAANTARRLFLEILRGAKSRGELDEDMG
jgi:hypothetical protein